MAEPALEPCPGCGVRLPRSTGPTHRYIGASAACWEIFSSLVNAGQPPLAPDPLNAILTDAYAAQHPGAPSPQSIQSVAVHLLVLYGVLVEGAPPEQAQWIRQRALRDKDRSRRGRYDWLPPPSFEGRPTVADIARQPAPAARTELARRYVRAVWDTWAPGHTATLAAWYQDFVLSDGEGQVKRRAR